MDLQLTKRHPDRDEVGDDAIAALTTEFTSSIIRHLGDGPRGAKALAALRLVLTPAELIELARNIAGNLIQGLL